jgi:diguanylate cyclase (GGDEF)-like protein/PAS domain S-box-containing protein
MALGFAAALGAVSELFFTSLVAESSTSAQMIGHSYRMLAYLFLFHATFNEALSRPLQRMQLQYEREKLILSASPDAVLWVDKDGFILMANPATEVLTGYPSVQLVGENVAIFLPEHQRGRHAKSIQDYFKSPQARAMGSRDLKLKRKDGDIVSVDISLGHWVEGGVSHAIAYIRDLSERKKFEESLHYQATHDELTGLANRWMFHLQLGQALVRSTRSELRVAILFIDLDDFKSVNDTYGHAVGDSLLVQTGARIRGLLREGDTLARMGGDEFAILLTDLEGMEEAISVASKVLAQLQVPYPLQVHEIQSGGSIGLAFYPHDANSSEALLRCADIAMYQAKHAGRCTYACYSHEMDGRVHEDMLLHKRLKEAIAHGQLELHYQPQVDIASGSVVGAEALLRWNDSVLGSISPTRFIPVAEATGLILPLSEWVLQTACEQLAYWENSGTPLQVAVNFSAQQFRNEGLSDQVKRALSDAGASAKLLTIEITETLAMARPERARQQLQALVALGCHVALDDFGTGYSSLAYLKVLPVQKLKIDKRFMDGVPDDGNDVAIVGAIIALAHSLGLKLVAEGVETELQLDFLRQSGCEVYQGWLYSKAIKAEALGALLQQQSLDGQRPVPANRKTV